MDGSDADDLRELLQGTSDAFGRLVRRHVNMVYAAARRQTGDPGLAEDVTQAVFLVLAKKAASLANYPTLAGWLVVTTRNIAKTALRSKLRRRKHEQAAAKAEGVAMDDPVLTAELGRLIDDALADLSAIDRDAVTLRLLENLSFADIGLTLNVSEEAARKRFDRAVVRLRSILTNKGLAITAAGLVSTSKTLAAMTAPPVLAVQITAAPSASAGVLAKGVLKMMTIKKVAMVTAAVLAASTVTGGLVVWRGNAPLPTAAFAQSLKTQNNPQPPAEPKPTEGEFYVGGQTQRPGAYSLDPRQGITITQALLAAGTPIDRPMKVRVIHRNDTQRDTVEEFSLGDLVSGKIAPPVQAGDQIMIMPLDAPPPQPVESNSGTLTVSVLALELPVRDVAANIAFFEKVGFLLRFADKPDAGGNIRRASVDSGNVRIRLARAESPITPKAGMKAHFWVDGGLPALTSRRDFLVGKGIQVSDIVGSGLPTFTFQTPDGYEFGFYTAN